MEYFAPHFLFPQQTKHDTSLNSNVAQPYHNQVHMPQIFNLTHSTGTIETKPRLGKDEVNILEREFKKNPKPSTQTKKAFAEEMNVDLPRINNWFQNRRAKRKQEIKSKKAEQSQAQVQAQETPIYSAEIASVSFPIGNALYSGEQHSNSRNASFSACQKTGDFPYNPELNELSNLKIGSLHQSALPIQSRTPMTHEAYLMSSSVGCGVAPSLDSDEPAFIENLSYECPSEVGKGNLNINAQISPRIQLPSGSLCDQMPEATSPASVYSLNNSSLYPLNSVLSEHLLQGNEMVSPLSPQSSFSNNTEDCDINNFGNSGLCIEQMRDAFNQDDDNCGEQMYASNYHQDINELPPAPSNIPFRSRPPMNIALRRKKVQHRPAALTPHTMSSRPVAGPSTMSHIEGFHLSANSPLGLPMRRIVSAGGNRAVVSGRVQKHGFEASQRSPLHIGGFENVGRFMEHNLHNIYNVPSLSGLSPLSGSLAPSTPSDLNSARLDGFRSATFPGEGNQNILIDCNLTNSFGNTFDEEGLKLISPDNSQPLPLDDSSFQFWANMDEFGEKNFVYKSADQDQFCRMQNPFTYDSPQNEPLLSKLTSQPVTPAFISSYKPTFFYDHPPPLYENDGFPCQSDTECVFADVNINSKNIECKITSDQKRFKFSHTTPADFSES